VLEVRNQGVALELIADIVELGLDCRNGDGFRRRLEQRMADARPPPTLQELAGLVCLAASRSVSVG
jgi:hypothetical protein